LISHRPLIAPLLSALLVGTSGCTSSPKAIVSVLVEDAPDVNLGERDQCAGTLDGPLGAERAWSVPAGPVALTRFLPLLRKDRAPAAIADVAADFSPSILAVGRIEALCYLHVPGCYLT
jgi:hypothetical protein